MDFGAIGDIASSFFNDIESAGSGLMSEVENLGSSIGSGIESWAGSIASDIGQGIEGLGSSLFNFGSDIENMFSDPGSIGAPDANSADPWGGYAPGSASSPTDMGPFGGMTSPSQSSGLGGLGSLGGLGGSSGGLGSVGGLGGLGGSHPLGSTNTTTPGDLGGSTANTSNDGSNAQSAIGAATQNDPELDQILNDPGSSVEDKIFAILMKLQKANEDKLTGLANTIDKAGGQPKQSDLIQLQKTQNTLSQLATMTTNFLKTFDDMKKAVIQNIR